MKKVKGDALIAQYRAKNYEAYKKHVPDCPPPNHWSHVVREKIGISIVPALAQKITCGRLMAKIILRFAELPEDKQSEFRSDLEMMLGEAALNLDSKFFSDLADSLHAPPKRESTSSLKTATRLEMYNFLVQHLRAVDQNKSRKALYNWISKREEFAKSHIDQSNFYKLLESISWKKTRLKK